MDISDYIINGWLKISILQKNGERYFSAIEGLLNTKLINYIEEDNDYYCVGSGITKKVITIYLSNGQYLIVDMPLKRITNILSRDQS